GCGVCRVCRDGHENLCMKPRCLGIHCDGGYSDQLVVPHSKPRILLVVIGRRSASAPASPSRGPGNGILRAETGGRIQARTAGERSEFGSQTATRLANRPKLRGLLPTRKPRRFARTGWWWTQSRRTGLGQVRASGGQEKFPANRQFIREFFKT